MGYPWELIQKSGDKYEDPTFGTVYGAIIRSKENEEGHRGTWRSTFGDSTNGGQTPTSEKDTPLGKGKTKLPPSIAELAKRAKQREKRERCLAKQRKINVSSKEREMVRQMFVKGRKRRS